MGEKKTKTGEFESKKEGKKKNPHCPTSIDAPTQQEIGCDTLGLDFYRGCRAHRYISTITRCIEGSSDREGPLP